MTWSSRPAPPGIPRAVEARSGLAAAGILARCLGVGRAAPILVEVAAAQLRGEPFRSLGPARDRREALSRRQAGPAVLLYRALSRRLPRQEALELTRQVVVAGTIVFLRHAIGPLDRDTLMSLSPSEREAFVQRIGAGFFNAEMRWDEISHARVRLTVTRCLFPGLCERVGAEDVAPLLCEGDAVYFGEVLGTVELCRPQTLAGGGDCCPFELTWK